MLEPCHGYIPESGSSLGFLEIDEVSVLVDLVEIHLVEVPDSGENNAILEFADIVQMLLKHCRVLFLGRQVIFGLG